MNSNSHIIIARLKEAMEYKHISAANLARAVGISTASMSQYLNGKVSPKQDRILLFAKALGVNALWLMGEDTIVKSNNKQISLSDDELNLLKTYRNANKNRQRLALEILTFE